MSTEPCTESASAHKTQLYKRKAASFLVQLQCLNESSTPDILKSFSNIDLIVRLKLLKKVELSFNSAHDSLEELDYDEIGSELSENFDVMLVELFTRVRYRLCPSQAQLSTAPTKRSSLDATQKPIFMSSTERPRRARLPEFKVPQFSGDYTEFANFISMFESIIDKDADLTDIERFQHLRSSLSGSALDAISSLELSEANYQVALSILHRRFNNKRLVFQSHIKGILGLKKVETASADKLLELSDKIIVHMRALETLGTAQEIAGCIIVNILLAKVDLATQTSWEESIALDKIPSSE